MTKSDKQEIKKLKRRVERQKDQIAADKKKSESLKKKISSSTSGFRKETKKQIVTALMAAFGFIIALVWRDAIKAYINSLLAILTPKGSPEIALLYTAIFTTTFAVIGILLVNHWASRANN